MNHTAVFLLTDFHHTGADGKLCVAETITEWISDLHPEGIKITVSYKDSFGIIFFCQIAIIVAEIVCIGIVLIAVSPCGSQSSAGTDSAG